MEPLVPIELPPLWLLIEPPEPPLPPSGLPPPTPPPIWPPAELPAPLSLELLAPPLLPELPLPPPLWARTVVVTAVLINAAAAIAVSRMHSVWNLVLVMSLSLRR